MTQDQLAVFLPPGRTGFRPGETLSVTVLWAFGAAPASLEARLFWRTQGKGTEDIEVVTQQSIQAPAVAGEQAVSFALPAGPWSFSGKLISLGWGVEVVASPGGQSARVEFVLGPDAREILLAPVSS